jgi:diguanylate cyclase (GGDEF)-like protein
MAVTPEEILERRRQEVEGQVKEAEGTAPEEPLVPDVPDRPALQQPMSPQDMLRVKREGDPHVGRAGGELSPLERQQRITALENEQAALTEPTNKNVWDDVKTTAQIAAMYPVAGKLARGETEIGLREMTKNLVFDQLPEADQRGIEQLAGKKVEDMKWRDLDRTARDFYKNDSDDWRSRLARMSGYAPTEEAWQRKRTGVDQSERVPGSLPEAFPEAAALIEGSLQTGAANFYEDVVRPIFSGDSPQLSQDMMLAVQEASRGYRPETRESIEKPLFKEDAIWYNPLTYFDETTKDPYHDLTGFMHSVGQQGGNVMGMVIGARLGGRMGSHAYTKSMTDKASTVEDILNAQKTGARFGGGFVGGKMEMSMVRDAVFSEVNQRILNDQTQEVWDNYEPYQRLVDGGLSPEEAKQIVAYEHANRAGDTAAAISGGLLGTPMGVFYGSLTGRSAGRSLAKESILKQMGKAGALEAGQEGVQELSEQVIGNLGVMRVNPDQDFWEGGLEAFGMGAITGGLFGLPGGVRSERGAGIAIAKDKMIRKSGKYIRAFNDRWKYQNKVGPNTKWAESSSPQDRLKAMVELERLQENEAREFLKVADEARQLLVDIDANPDELIAFDAKTEGYKTDLAFITKRKRNRLEAKAAQREEREAARERAEARAQVERDVNVLNQNLRLVENMQKVQRGETLKTEEYEELVRLGYGVFPDQGNFALTQRGVRSMQEMAKEAADTRSRIDQGVTTGERRTDRTLREAYEDLSDEEFESAVLRDPTTNLWNRRKLDQDIRDLSVEMIKRAADDDDKRGPPPPPGAAGMAKEKKPKAFAFIDADALKWVNDNMSHSAGDEYIRTISRELEGLGRGIEAYRRGGDEFVLIGPSQQVVETAVERALSRINAAPRIEEAGKSVKVAASAGFGASVEEAEAGMKQDKQRRTREGLRADTRVEGVTPPSLHVGENASEHQMSLFAMSRDRDQFNDDMWGFNNWDEEDWAAYSEATKGGLQRELDRLNQVEDEHYEWLSEVISDFLPASNRNNPPITLVHNYRWLKELSPNQYKELMDLPFGAHGVRGLFSMDDPTHGVFLMADVIIDQAKAGLKRGDRIVSWGTAKYSLKEGDQIEVLDELGKVQIGTVKEVDYKRFSYVRYGTQLPSEKRASKKAIGIRRELNRLIDKELRMLRQHSKMQKQKQENPDHPLNKQLAKLQQQMKRKEAELRLAYDEVITERTKRITQEEQAADQSEDKVVVEMKDGSTIEFDPKENAPVKMISGDQSSNWPEYYLGRYRHGPGRLWVYNLGNEEASLDEKLTKEHVQRIAADTVMHETIGHYGVRGITRDWDSYVRLTHAIVDAFPEVVAELRVMGYTYREDLKRGEELNDANKALLGEEVMAWTAGRILSKEGMQGMNATQRGAVSRFLTWFKEQLLKLGFNKLYRRIQAKQIRALRRKMHAAKGEKREEYRKQLMGYLDEKGNYVPGLTFVGVSGTRQAKGWIKGKGYSQKSGVVVRASKGFLNDTDLLNIIQRSLDYVRSGRRKWKFKDHAGNSHLLPMRDIEIFRKPIHYVLQNGYRPRTEDEKLTAEDLEAAAPIPTMAEAYEELFGEPMPGGFKVLSPADFKDESKRIEREMMEGKSDEEIKQMRQDRVFPNPKQLYDEAVKEMEPELLAAGRAISGLIAKRKKEAEFKAKGLKSKKAAIADLEKRWGKEAVDNDMIPIFPEVSTVQGYIDAMNAALPASNREGYITPMEVEASGFLSAIWPSRIAQLVADGEIDPQVLAADGDNDLTVERIEQLMNPATPMTEAEAEAIIKHLQVRNQLINTGATDMWMPYVDESSMSAKRFAQNTNLTPKDFVQYVANFVPTGQEQNLATLVALMGETPLTEQYRKAMSQLTDPDPNVQLKARVFMDHTMNTPLGVSTIPVTKDWIAWRIEEPIYDVIAMYPDTGQDMWENHYERIVGHHPDVDGYDEIHEVPQPLFGKINSMMNRDLNDGPFYGYDEKLQRWIKPEYTYRNQDEWSGLFPTWVASEHKRNMVFWQLPYKDIETGHFSWAMLKDRNQQGPGGIFGHARFAATYDADPNAPTAPNPDMQGMAFVPFENQSDFAQGASKMYPSQEALDNAKAQHNTDTRVLNSMGRNYIQNLAGKLLDVFETEFEAHKEINGGSYDDVFVKETFHPSTIAQTMSMDDFYAKYTPKQIEILRDIAIMRRFRGNWDLVPGSGLFNQIEQEALAASERMNRAASGGQQSWDPRSAPPQNGLNISFVGDARMFEWNDHRAVAHMMKQFALLRKGILESINHYQTSADPESRSFKWLQQEGGLIKMLRKQVQDPRGYGKQRKMGQKINTAVEYSANTNTDNQPVHRIPFMEGVMNEYMERVLSELDYPLKRGQSHASLAKQMFDEATNQQQMTITIDIDTWSDLLTADLPFTVTPHELDEHVRNYFVAGGLPFVADRGDNGHDLVARIFGTEAQLKSVKDNLRDGLADYLRDKVGEGDLSSLISEQNRIVESLERKWMRYPRGEGLLGDGTRTLEYWQKDFDLKLARLMISEDPNEPFVHALPTMAEAGGVTIEAAHNMFDAHGIESFADYAKRRWNRWWNNADDEERAEFEAQGGSEETPTDEAYASFAQSWNERKPFVMTGRIPVAWDQQSNPTKWVNATWIRTRVDEDAEAWINEDEEEGLDSFHRWQQWSDVNDSIGWLINEFYENEDVTVNPWKFQSLRGRIRALKAKNKEIQERIDTAKGEHGTAVTSLFETEEVMPVVGQGEYGDLSKTFLREIDYYKKTKRVRRMEPIQKNDQWRIMQMLAGISEAVRHGYPRMHLIPGSASGARGGFLHNAGSSGGYWHHTNQINYTLTKKELRGEMRDILMVTSPTIQGDFWIDVTEDKLLPINPNRTISDNSIEPLEGYFSGQIAQQLGRDVAEKIGEKLRISRGSLKAGRLLITRSANDLWLLQDAAGNVLSSHPSKRAAQNARKTRLEAAEKEQAELPESFSGSIGELEIGGPIMIPKTQYYGGTSYNFEYQDHYQHTFQPPTLVGGRGNYDLVMISRFRAYLRKFGLDIEEGWAKVDSHEMEDAVFAAGMRRKVRLPTSFIEQYPNVRIEEVEGENYGFIILSDNGLVTPHVYPTSGEADAVWNDMLSANAVNEDGQIKVMQITFNDAIIKEHRKPINPWLNVNWQVENSTPELEALLDKIGEKRPSLIDRYKEVKRTWAASLMQGMFDRFHGVLHALRLTGSSLEGYMQLRLTTGLESIMRSSFEHGHLVWRDGVVEAEGKGLLKILEPVGDVLKPWGGFMVGRRAKLLMMEGYAKVTDEERALLNKAAKHFVGDTDEERVWQLLVHLTQEEVTDEQIDETRRSFLKGAAAGMASGMMPGGGGDIDEVARKLVIPALREGVTKKIWKQRAGKRRALARGSGRVADPEKVFRSPESWRYQMRKKIMDETGATKEQADAAIGRVVKGALEDQKVADAVRREMRRQREKDEQMSADVEAAEEAAISLIAEGREKFVSAAQAEAGIELGDQFPKFHQVADEYAEWNKKMLDFAQEAGVINEESRAAWEHAEYVPFYRIIDDRGSGPMSAGSGVTDLSDPIKRLTGGQHQLGDIVNNIFISSTRLVDAAIKNNAARTIAAELEPTGMMVKLPDGFQPAVIPGSEIEKVLRLHDIDPDKVPPEVVKGVQVMFALAPPKGKNIVGVMRNGKQVYYHVEDPLLYRALSAVNMEQFGKLMNIARAPKRLLTTAVTLDPGFMIANFIRDSMSAWVLSRDGYIPMVDGLRGAIEAMREGETMRAMIASGAAFDSGFLNQGDPKATHRYIQQAMKDVGFQRSVLNTGRKMWNAYKKLGSGLENANRVAIYDAAIKSGKSKLEAAYEAKDVMDFSMSGDWVVVQFLIQSVPFMNARMQGLYRLGRGAKENPVAFALKGSLIMMAGMALWLKFRDDPRYERLEDWDKDTYFHFWVGEHHFRIPKGFEVGAIFNTIPERAFEYMWSQENDAGKHLMKRFGFMLHETFNVNPIPQTIRPMTEMLVNKNFFTGRYIESPWEQERLPRDRYRYYTSPTMREIASHMPEMTTVLNGKISSPLQLQNIYAGYTGTLGRYALMGADAILRRVLDYPVPPDWRDSDWPVMGRFYRGREKEWPENWATMPPEELHDYRSTRRTRFEEAFYRELDTMTQVMNSLRMNEVNENDPRYEEIEAAYNPEIERAREFQSMGRELSKINKEVREVYRDDEMTGAEKRKELDDLQRDKNEIFEEAYRNRPGAAEEPDLSDIESIIDSIPPTGEINQQLADQAPETARLVADVSGLSKQQLERLSRAANYRRRT